MKRLSFKEAYSIWNGRKRTMTDMNITVWTLVVIAITSIVETIIKTTVEIMFKKKFDKKKD